MKTTNRPQVDFWRGEFGDAYIERNAPSSAHLFPRVKLWAEIVKHTIQEPPASILEVGANIGLNLRALRVLTDARLMALEPNDKARGILVEDRIIADSDAVGGTAEKIDLPDDAADLAFTSGVLIHIHPDDLVASMREIYRCAKRWIVCVEYFSDKAETIPYRGHQDRLFKRDFGGLWLDTFPQLNVVAYGFAWKRVTGLDNLTWWLLRKP